MTFFDPIVYLISMFITVVYLISAWFLDSELSTCFFNACYYVLLYLMMFDSVHEQLHMQHINMCLVYNCSSFAITADYINVVEVLPEI